MMIAEKASALILAAAQGRRVLHMSSGRASLEDVFVHLTGRPLRDGAAA